MKLESQNNTHNTIPLSNEAILEIANSVAQGEDTELWEELTLSLLFESSPEMRKLNREFRDIDRATDILSFPDREGEELPFPSFFLGDLVIAPEVVERHAKSYGVSLQYEYSFVLVHGLLHLFGYDHQEKGEQKVMREKEKFYMQKLGFDGVSR
ncbi:rRNA maturation RNase YbeY [bacterium]|nr:rRNA maturation RNase YbeY [bacterium]